MVSNDILSVMDWKLDVFDLDTCALVLPRCIELLENEFEYYAETGLKSSIKLFCSFSPIVKSTKDLAKKNGRRRMDYTMEERYVLKL